jgi:hypothetical protein
VDVDLDVADIDRRTDEEDMCAILEMRPEASVSANGPR